MDPKAVVYALLERWGSKPQATINDGDRLREDIQMDGDDYGMSFVPALEDALGFHASREEWEAIVTVGDVLKLLSRKLGSR